MGNKSSLMLQHEEVKQISDETSFSPMQIEKLYSRFAHLDKTNCGTLDKNDFLSIPELAINPLCDRLIYMFFSDSSDQQNGRINFKQFIRVLATFKTTSNGNSTLSLDKQTGASVPIRTKNDHNYSLSSDLKIRKSNLRASQTSNARPDSLTDRLSEGVKCKLLFIFRIYDADNDGQISLNDLRSIIKMMVGNNIEDVQLDKIATRAFKEADKDNDGFILFDEFCRVFSLNDLDNKLRIKFLNQ